MNRAEFRIEKEKCIGCGLCINVCAGGIISLDENHVARIADFQEFGWDGCWKCQHCLAVCPKGAISILGKHPENSLPPPDIEQAAQGIYARTFDAHYYGLLKQWEATVRPDMLFCSAPHILIPHAPIGKGCWVQDVNIACTYFELLCASRGLGAVFMIYPLSVLENMPDIKALLQIPEDHYVGMMVGFGYPEITYARGVQRGESGSIHRLRFTEEAVSKAVL